MERVDVAGLADGLPAGASTIEAWPVSTATYVVSARLGQGTFGQVFAAWRQSNWESPMQVALKVTPRHALKVSRELEMMLLLRRNPHPSIMTLFEYFCVPSMAHADAPLMLLCQVMPLCRMSLRDFVLEAVARMGQASRLAFARHIGAEVADGLAHLHSMHIAHRDLKPENVLICTNDDISWVPPHGIRCLIADFGCAKPINMGPDNRGTTPSCCLVYAPIYRAPELYWGSTSYSFSPDVWAFGCVVVRPNRVEPAHRIGEDV